jgi:hypothetical protein
LARRGRRYAAEVGISFNALLAIALREYLDAPGGKQGPYLRHQHSAKAIPQRVQAGLAQQKR